MGTRCMISRHKKDGYHAIHSHFDGYPKKPGVGWMLKKYYGDTRKIDKLIALGSISSLGSEIGKKHDFRTKDSMADEWTTAYHRDRGEPKEMWKFKTFDELLGFACSSSVEYLYWYEKGKWQCINLSNEKKIRL